MCVGVIEGGHGVCGGGVAHSSLDLANLALPSYPCILLSPAAVRSPPPTHYSPPPPTSPSSLSLLRPHPPTVPSPTLPRPPLSPLQINVPWAVKTQTITRGLKYSLATGNWGQQGTQGIRAGVSQVGGGEGCHYITILRCSIITSLFAGAESPHVRVLPVAPPPRQLAHRSGGQAGQAAAAAQQPVGHVLPCGNPGGTGRGEEEGEGGRLVLRWGD